MRRILPILAMTLLPALLAAAPADGQARPSPWMRYADPAEAGFSAEALEEARRYADSAGSAAVVAVHRGRVLVAWGDVAREYRLHSVRKSLVSVLYGASPAGGIDLDATLAELGIDDDAGLTAAERGARVRDLLAARSGVYLPAAYAPGDQDEERPARGAHPPGTRWFYNNWDFNVAGVAYERMTGEELYRAFAARVAEPLGMEDWEPEDGYPVYEPSLSRHPAHTFRMSARDLARVGWTMLDGGRWEGRQVVPAAWVEESTRPHSDFGNGTGYGWMWWTHAAGSSPDLYVHLDSLSFYMGRGSGGQALFVIPGAELVIVHRGDTDAGEGIIGAHAWALAERILAARTGEPSPRPRLVPLEPGPSARPSPDLATLTPVDSAAAAPLLGGYEIAPGVVATVFLFRDRAYVRVPGEGEGELFRRPDGTFTLRVVSGVGIDFERAPDGRATAMTLSMGERRMRGERVPAP